LGIEHRKARRSTAEILLELLNFQVRNNLSQDDMLLMMSVYNTSLILEILERRLPGRESRTPAAALRDPVAVLGQLLGSRAGDAEGVQPGRQLTERGKDATGPGNLAGLLNRHGGNPQTLLPALLTLLRNSSGQQSPTVKPAKPRNEDADDAAGGAQDVALVREETEEADSASLLSTLTTLLEMFPPRASQAKAPAKAHGEKSEAKTARLAGGLPEKGSCTEPQEKRKAEKTKPEVLQWNFGRPGLQASP